MSREVVPVDLLKDWQGYLMSDGYGAYDEVGHRPDVELLAYWVPARRGFVDAIKVQPKGKEGRANDMVKVIADLYQVEKDGRPLTCEERLQLRQDISEPILDTSATGLMRTCR